MVRHDVAAVAVRQHVAAAGMRRRIHVRQHVAAAVAARACRPMLRMLPGYLGKVICTRTRYLHTNSAKSESLL